MGVLLGFEPRTLKIMPMGVTIIFSKYMSFKKIYLKEMLVALAGPIVNIVIAILGLIFNYNINIVYANLLIAIFNLIPIFPLDGGRILKAILNINFDSIVSSEITYKVANITMIILTITTSIAILYLKNIGLFFIIVYLWGILIQEKKRYMLKQRVYNAIKKQDLHFLEETWYNDTMKKV